MTQTHRPSEPMALILMGMLAGAAGALLFAPRSGRETREKVKEMSTKLRDDTMHAKEELVSKVRGGAEKVSSEIQEKAETVADKMDTAKSRGGRKTSELNRATPYTDSMEV